MTDEVWLGRVADRVVARYIDGRSVPQHLVPRPYLHLSTLEETPLTEAYPADHAHHLGLSISIPLVGSTNFWGGNTYVRGEGYRDLPNRGRIESVKRAPTAPGHLVEDLRWVDLEDAELLTERRSIGCSSNADGTWQLRVSFQLTNTTQTRLELHSPGSNGCRGSGYGGLFWRLPLGAPAEMSVLTTCHEGEQAVHGTIAPWLAVTRAPRTGDSGYTVVLRPDDDAAARDPWFVRLSDYQGVGSSVAAKFPASLGPGTRLSRSFRITIADGALDRAAVSALVEP